MVRVLHVIDHRPDFQASRSVANLPAAQLGADFRTETFALGTAATRNPILGSLRLRQVSRDADVVHAWGSAALRSCTLVRKPLCFTPEAEITGRSVRWLSAQMNYRDANVLCPTATLRRRLVETGIPLDRCHLVRPGVEFRRVRSRRERSAVRQSLGIADGDVVLLAIGESTRMAGHDFAVWAGSILHVMDPKFRVLLWGRGERTASLIAFARELCNPGMIVSAERVLGRVDFEQVLPAVDVAVASAIGPIAPLATAICMAAGLPIVASVTPTLAELLEDRHNALLVAPRAPRKLARRVLDLLDDPALQWQLGDMARTEAYQYFAASRFVDQHRTAYRQIVGGGKVELREQAPGAGARFHGRA